MYTDSISSIRFKMAYVTGGCCTNVLVVSHWPFYVDIKLVQPRSHRTRFCSSVVQPIRMIWDVIGNSCQRNDIHAAMHAQFPHLGTKPFVLRYPLFGA